MNKVKNCLNFLNNYLTGILFCLLNIVAGILCVSAKEYEGSIFIFAGSFLLGFMLYDNKYNY